MTYANPEVFCAPRALQMIQGSAVKLGIYLESNQVTFNATAAAYDADD